MKDTEGETAGTSAVDRAFEKLDKMGYLYTKDGALWFRSTDLGDDKDRVLIKSDGEYTYFASDVAYHWDKFQRVDHVIDIWGADHHGYIERVRCVCDALGYPASSRFCWASSSTFCATASPSVCPSARAPW